MKWGSKQFARFWYDALHRVNADDRPAVSQLMLKKLVREGQYRRLSEIMRAMQVLDAKEQASEEVLVVSARKLSAAAAQKIVSDLVGHDRLVIRQAEDPALIGGAIVQTADRRWDLSLRHQLRRLQKSVSA